MDITYDESLIEYMKKKKYTAIVIEQIDPIGCCADTSELLLRFVNEKGADKLRDQAIRQLDIHFGLRSFLGLKDISVSGIRHWTL